MDLNKLEALLSKIAAIHPDLATEIEALSITTTPVKPVNISPNGDAWTGPIPPQAAITYMQTTVWDNGAEPKFNANGNKKKQPQFSATIEAYTLPLDSLLNVGLVGTYRFKRNVQLRPRKDFLELVKKNNKTGRITDEFRDFLVEITNHQDVDPAKDRFGFVIDSGTWKYHQGQFVHLRWSRTDEPDVLVIQNYDFTQIDTWDFEDNGSKKKWINADDRCGYRAAKHASSGLSSPRRRPSK